MFLNSGSIGIWGCIFFFEKAILCIVGCLVASLASTSKCQWHLPSSCNNQNVSRCPLGGKPPPPPPHTHTPRRTTALENHRLLGWLSRSQSPIHSWKYQVRLVSAHSTLTGRFGLWALILKALLTVPEISCFKTWCMTLAIAPVFASWGKTWQ